MTTEVLRSMLYRGSEITREAALVVRHDVLTAAVCRAHASRAAGVR